MGDREAEGMERVDGEWGAREERQGGERVREGQGGTWGWRER